MTQDSHSPTFTHRRVAGQGVASQGIAGHGVSLHAVELGANDDSNRDSTAKPLMLFLHGFPECWRSWRPIMRALCDAYFCVAIDNRGFGESDKPNDVAAYAMDNIVADIAAVIQAYGNRPTILVGHDWGGIAAWHFAAKHPEQLAALVLLNAPHPTLFQRALINNPAQQQASQYINRLRHTDAQTRINALGLEPFWMSLFGEHFKRGTMSAADKDYYLATWAKPGALTAMLNWYRANVRDDWATAPDASVVPLANVSTPTLVLWAMNDSLLLPSLLDGLEAFASELSIKTIDGAGHGLLHEVPERIVNELREWLRGVAQ
jgi:pimeloyl-ACP methyl ester carboxylesterase